MTVRRLPPILAAIVLIGAASRRHAQQRGHGGPVRMRPLRMRPLLKDGKR
jgi:hypothetical protein